MVVVVVVGQQGRRKWRMSLMRWMIGVRHGRKLERRARGGEAEGRVGEAFNAIPGSLRMCGLKVSPWHTLVSKHVMIIT